MMELFCEKKEKIPIWQFSIYAFDIYLIQQTYQVSSSILNQTTLNLKIILE